MSGTLTKVSVALRLTQMHPDHMQNHLDRGLIEHTSVKVGSRTFRKFNREQLVRVMHFATLVECGVRPAWAAELVKLFMEYPPQFPDIQFALYHPGARSGPPVLFLEKGKTLENLGGRMNGNGVVLVDHAGIVWQVDNMLTYPMEDELLDTSKDDAEVKA